MHLVLLNLQSPIASYLLAISILFVVTVKELEKLTFDSEYSLIVNTVTIQFFLFGFCSLLDINYFCHVQH